MNLNRTFYAITALVVCLAVSPTQWLKAQYDGAIPPPEPLRPGFEAITQQECEQWLNVLAGPGFQGRGTGQEGYFKAASWVSGKLAEFGLKPMGDAGTYFQMLPMSRLLVDAAQSKITGPNDLVLGFDKKIGLDRFIDQPEFAGKVVFLQMAGEGAKIADDLNIENKFVVLVADDQAASANSFRLSRKRASAVLRVVETEPTSTPQQERPNNRQRGNGIGGSIQNDAAKKILEAVGGKEEWLTIPEENAIDIHETDVELKAEVRIRKEPIAVPNVLAWQEGSDPALRDEYIVIGAHLDHLGQRGNEYFAGADDNGSGSTALLSIAKAIAANPTKPKRSILFMWFAAEEIGLVGSAHYVNNPILPLEKMICMLNVDMVGRNEEKPNEPASENVRSLHLVGSEKGDKSLHALILEANKAINFEFEFDEEGVFGRSDQINFFKKGTSVAFLFGGFHPDYHRTTDTPDKINYAKIASAAKLYFLVTHMAAEHGPFPAPKEPEPVAKP
ncbi:MAG: M28 family metallopeptidase [Pirellula sp.]